MSQPAGTEPVGTQGDPTVNTEGSTGEQQQQQPIEPVVPDAPYKEQLDSLPESVRPLVEPIFKDWDGKTTQRFQELHSQYEPWKDVTESFDPEQVRQAIQLAQYMETNPQGLYEALAKAYGLGEQGQQPQQSQTPATGEPVNEPGDGNEDAPWRQELDELKQMLTGVAQHLGQQTQQEQMSKQQQMLDQALESLHGTHGEFDDNYVITLIASGVDPETAIKQFKDTVGSALTQQQTPAAPTVIGGGGGQPVEAVDPATLSPADRKAYVADLLAKSSQAAG